MTTEAAVYETLKNRVKVDRNGTYTGVLTQRGSTLSSLRYSMQLCAMGLHSLYCKQLPTQGPHAN